MCVRSSIVHEPQQSFDPFQERLLIDPTGKLFQFPAIDPGMKIFLIETQRREITVGSGAGMQIQVIDDRFFDFRDGEPPVFVLL